MIDREKIVQFLKSLREKIIQEFETFESYAHFERKPWEHHTGGGGEIGILRGTIFEKAAVNFSAVSGPQFPMQEGVISINSSKDLGERGKARSERSGSNDEAIAKGSMAKEEERFGKAAANRIPDEFMEMTPEGSGPFFATGISLITHMQNPHAPTVHMNLRYIETEKKKWFGGGYDLTPMGFPYQTDKDHFHGVAKKSLDPFGEHLYPQFSQQARDYFYIPHWKKERGVGGIFFDHYNSGDEKADLALWQGIGNSFLETILPIYRSRVVQSFTREDKETQLLARAHYVEFNLLYDRGTQFGFKSGGNPEAILCSMPPLAKW